MPAPRSTFYLLAIAILATLIQIPAAAQDAPRVQVIRFHDDALVDLVHACDALLQKGAYRDGVEAAQQILDTCANAPAVDEVHAFPLVQNATARRLWLSVPVAIARRLAALPLEARKLHESLYGKLAAANREKALLVGDRMQLLRLVERFPTTQAGRATRLQLGQEALEAGRTQEAAMHLLRWINERPTDDSPPPTAVLAMLALALAENGELAAADALGEASRSIRIAGKETTLSRFVEEHVNRNTAPAPQFPTDRPMGAPTWLQKDTSDDHPSNPTVIANGRVFRLTPDRLTARDLTSGKLLWARTTDADETPLPPDRSPRHRARALSVANGVCVFVRQATRDTRSLLAVHSKTGATLWQRTAKNPSPNDHSASKSTLLWSSAALVTEDSIHIGAHDTASQPNSWLVTLDLSSGQERWRTRIGGGVPLPFETRAGQLPRPETWVSCTRPALIAGSILVGDNLGTLAALDFRTGQPIWVYRYERRRAVNTSRFGQSSLKRGWDDSSIHAEGLRFVVSPEDSDRAFCFFTNPPPVSDRPLSHVDFVLNDVWERSGLSRVLGFNNGTVYLAGRDRSEDLDVVEAWTPAGEEHLQAWSSPAPMDTPVAGALIVGDNGLYVSTDKYVYCINRSSGEVSNPLITHEASPGLFLGDLYLTREGLLIAAPMGLSFWSHGK